MRLEITRRTDLATRALLELGSRAERMKSADLAGAVGTTAGFLAQALRPLVNAEWVRSDPGPSGGYLLVANLAELSVLDIVEAVEGPTDTGRCVLQSRPCSSSGLCALHEPWARARHHLLAELAKTSLASLDPAYAVDPPASPGPARRETT